VLDGKLREKLNQVKAGQEKIEIENGNQFMDK
jgi:hypothetical protein